MGSPRFTLGCMTWGATTSEAEAREIFVEARERGIHAFDTAEAYNEGRSEQMLGRMIADCRESVSVSTKIGYDLSAPLDVRKSIEGCLGRLGTDYLDIVYLHRFGAMPDRNKRLGEMVLIQHEGLVRKIGVSNCAAWQVQPCVNAIQPQYSMLKRQAEVELFPMALERGIEVHAYSPLARGLLAGKPRGDLHPRYRKRFERTGWQALEDFLQLDRSPVQTAIGWAAGHPAVASVIIGPRTSDQLRRCCESVRLSEDDRGKVAIAPDPDPAHDRWEERA